VALRILGQLGYRADLAANGLEAIDAVGRQAYDVVLMDVQMPELDGFEASREINRRWSRHLRPRIVAMTANAMQGDRELCVAAGMDDYVAKPIRVEELIAALERSPRRLNTSARGAPGAPVGSDGATLASMAPQPPRESDAPKGTEPILADAVERSAFDRLQASMGGAFVAELVDTFIEDAQDLVAALRQALAGADVDTFRRAAHSLKSTGETVGATRLAAVARELEAQARTGTLDGAGGRLDQLVGEYERAVRALGELRRDLIR
jgi:CheY-like chemotaxis protein